MSNTSFADLGVHIYPDEMNKFLHSVSLGDGGLYMRCLAIAIENGFDKLEDDAFMIERTRLPKETWQRKKRWIRKSIKQTHNKTWFVPDEGMA